MSNGSTKLKVESHEAGLEFLRNWIPQGHQGLSWAILMSDNEGFTVHTRFYQPCYGEMRPYGKNSDRPEDRKPSDLHDPFPKGTPEAIAVPFSGNTVALTQSVIDTIFDPNNSPWRAVLRDFELLSKGVIIKDTEIDPTLMVNLFMFLRYYNGTMFWSKKFDALLEAMPDANRNILLMMPLVGAFGLGHDYSQGRPHWVMDYVIHPRFSMKRLNSGDFVTLSKDTFRNRSAYNRPQLDHVFGDECEHIGKFLTSKGLVTETLDDAKKVYETLVETL